jgi:hypothetical protein
VAYLYHSSDPHLNYTFNRPSADASCEARGRGVSMSFRSLRLPCGLTFLFALLIAAGMVASGPSATAQLLDATLPLQYIPLEIPCRALDTRTTNNPIKGGTSQNFSPGSGGCSNNVPTPTGGGVIAYALNITAVPHGPLGLLTAWPTGDLQPNISTLNSDGRVKANAAIVTGGTNGQISIFASNTTDVVLDVSGYFVAQQGSPNSYTFYPLTPCRLVDTRTPNGQFGSPSLVGGQQRTFVMSQSSCNLPTAPEYIGGAFSLNVTAIPKAGKPVGVVKVWGTSLNYPDTPVASTLNASTGTVTANAVIVASNGSTFDGVTVYTSDDTDLVIDVNGYFSLGGFVPGGLSLYTLPPCRILDTRPYGLFQGERKVTVTTGNNCPVNGAAKAFVMNATVVPPGGLGLLKLWADGATQPGVSTLNAYDGDVTSNMAIVGTTNGSIDAFASNPTQLVMDISAYFAP